MSAQGQVTFEKRNKMNVAWTTVKTLQDGREATLLLYCTVYLHPRKTQKGHSMVQSIVQ